MTRDEYITALLTMSAEERHMFILGQELALGHGSDPEACSDVSYDALTAANESRGE